MSSTENEDEAHGTGPSNPPSGVLQKARSSVAPASPRMITAVKTSGEDESASGSGYDLPETKGIGDAEATTIQTAANEASTATHLSTRYPPTADQTTTTPTPTTADQCSQYRLWLGKSEDSGTEEELKCKPHQPSAAACKYTAAEYASNANYKSICSSNNIRADVCKEQPRTRKNSKRKRFSCSLTACGPSSRSTVRVSMLDPVTGKMNNAGEFNQSRKLEGALTTIALATVANGYNFVFLDCLDGLFNKRSQLLTFPRGVSRKERVKKRAGSHSRLFNFDISLVLLDSVSRRHFYRSLPQAIKTAADINQRDDLHADILDFEMFQSVYGHSSENLHALFTGKLLPDSMTEKEKEMPSCGIGTLFSHVKSNGYRTLFQDDLCWEYVWGLRADIAGGKSWDEFDDVLANNSVDSTGLTFSSCALLAYNNAKTPFNGPKWQQLCHNDQFIHDYVLDYIHELHNQKSRGHPVLSHSTIDVGHDGYGLRIQTFDRSLSRFFDKISQPDYNTLTILYADHGNTYTQYASSFIDGSFEMYQPSMFVIVPSGVKEQLGDDVMRALRVNRKRLFTLIDVHNTIKYLTSSSNAINGTVPLSKGLAEELSKKRTCDNLDLAMPNYCQCDGYEISKTNSSTHIGIVDFALGTLNNRISTSRREEQTEEGSATLPRCHVLAATFFENVRERADKATGRLITSMDIHVQSGLGAGRMDDTFRVYVRSTVELNNPSREYELIHYDRISRYGVYVPCKDSGVNIRMCVCDVTPPVKMDDLAQMSTEHFLNSSLFGRTPLYGGTQRIIAQWHGCFYVVQTTYPGQKGKGKESVTAISISAMNVCHNQTQIVDVTSSATNMKRSSLSDVTRASVSPNSLSYVFTLMQTYSGWSSSASITLTDVKINSDFTTQYH